MALHYIDKCIQRSIFNNESDSRSESKGAIFFKTTPVIKIR
jgi:hypothetical protein